MISDSENILTNALRPSRSIQEFRIDFLLEEEFTVDLAFTQAFVAACGSPLSVQHVERVVHSVSDKHGEADLIVLVAVDRLEGRTATLALLIEDKINAGFQPGQPYRYRQRGETGVSIGSWDSFVTVLVAPSSYLSPSHGFDAAVSLEEISEWICPADAVRRAFKVAKIKEAIRKKTSTGVQVVDRALTEFRAAYYDNLQAFNLQHGTDFTMRLPAPTYHGDTWFYLKSSSLPAWAEIRHMATNGNIEISFKDTDFLKTDALREFLEGDMVLMPTGKYKQHVTVRLSTPKVPVFDSFERVHPEIETTFLSAERLWRFYQRERARFEAVLLPARRK
jgi:hypothetical protein